MIYFQRQKTIIFFVVVTEYYVYMISLFLLWDRGDGNREY